MAGQRGTTVVIARWKTLLAAVTLSLAGLTAQAGVVATVDRPSVDLNESFNLKIVVDSGADTEPDWSVLDQNFYRGQVSELTNTTIVNSQIRRSRTWEVALMAKSTGALTIPAIKVGDELSQPVSITINEPSKELPGEADVFVSSEIDQKEAYVQAQVLYRIKVYLAVQTRQATLRDPVFSGAETLIELAGDERSYDAILNGKSYKVVERLVAIYPQESGEISISPARFEARILRDGRITGRKVFDSNAHTINVLPIPAPPAEHPSAAWLPARDVQLSEEWSRSPDNIEAGEPVTRHVTISALGQLETQIPALDPPQIDGMNIYADKPDLSRQIEANGIRGIRKDQYAMIGVSGGAVGVPELEVPWWDIDAGEWRVARLPSREIQVAAVAAPVAAEPTIEEATSIDETAAIEVASEQPVVDGFWRLATQLLAFLWAVTVLAWWWSTRDNQRVAKEPAPPPIYKQQAKYVKAARKAAASGDATAVRAALLEWGRLQWPDNAPRSIGEFANRVASPLSEQLREFSAASYGNGNIQWDGPTMAKNLRTIKLLTESVASMADDPLPPLMPPGT